MTDRTPPAGLVGRDFRLRIVASDVAGRAGQDVAVDGPVLIGRDEACTIVLADPSVSRRHAEVTRRGDGLRVVDLNSGNGVWMGNERIREATLRPGDRVRIGSTVFECIEPQAVAAAPPPAVTPARPAPAPASTPGAVNGRFAVRVTLPGDAVRRGQTFLVDKGSAVVGRAADCDVVLPEVDISRRHARIDVVSGGFRVTDLGSACGTWVDDHQVDTTVVRPGQAVRIGRRVVVVCEAVAAEVAEEDAATVFSGVPATLAEQPPAPAGAPPQAVDEDATGAIPAEVLARLAAGPAPAKVETAERLEAEPTDETRALPPAARAAFSGAAPAAVPAPAAGPEPESDATRVMPVPAPPEPAERLEAEPTDETRALPPAARAALTGTAPAAVPPPTTRPEPEEDATRVMPVPAPPTPAPEPAEPEADEYATRVMPAMQVDSRSDAAVPLAAGEAPEDGESTRMITREQLAAFTASAAATPDDFESNLSQTIVMQAPARLATAVRGLEEEGEVLEVSAHRPFLLDDPSLAYYVVSGGVLIFAVAIENGVPVGTRVHLLGILERQGMFGFDTRRYGFDSGLLAVPKPGTVMRRIPVARLRELAAGPQRPAVAALIETWVAGLSKAIVRNLTTRRSEEIELRQGQETTLGPLQKATSAEGVVWIDIWSGSVLFDDMSTPTFSRKRVLFPVTPHSWIQPVGDEFGDLSVVPITTEQAVGSDDLWHGLDVLHQVLCESEFLGQRLSTADEFLRLQQKAQHAEAAEAAGYGAIGSVLRAESETPQELLQAAVAEPVLAACTLVGRHLGMEVRSHLEGSEQLAFEDLVNSIATASGFRTRMIALRDDWWRRDLGPVLGQWAETKAPIAVLPTSPRSYEVIDPKTGERKPVDAGVAAAISPFAYTFYQPLPEGALTPRRLVAFGARGLKSEFLTVGAMAGLLGVLGTVTPYFTGQLFDSAIPQADRNALTVFTLALFATAIATSLFKFTQGIATVRVQARMESKIQAAVWDRLLDLPVNFFRRYAAGDLADRAAGVDQIQELVSGAGVAAILGSVSGLFYVVQMFAYNLRLALLALLLTAIYVTVTTTLNYLQLRYQRVEMQLRGRIQGLVLNLIGGVSKLRVCGAERHAFRVWAEQFAQQRRLTFSVGTIQNVGATFSAVYPVLSSIAIFLVMIAEQQAAAASGQPGLTTGEFIAFNAAYGLFLGAMQALGDASLSLLRIVPIYERLSPVLVTEPEVDRSKAYPGKLKGQIEISRLKFRYDPDGPWIVNDLSLTIKPGEFVAFVGGSGCGKSTLMRLMLGFERPASGSIYYDGQDLASLDLRLLRQQIGVVLQVSRVMPTEMWRNITGATARTIEDAWWAAERAGLADDIRNMPMGMHTYVAEGGGTLSGGQRQRLMIARAIVNRPKILFLDEATSALDNRTQAIVTESMSKMEATRIVIAHRLSTIIDADKICYLEAGQIVEMGTYAELMALNGKFAELARRQVA